MPEETEKGRKKVVVEEISGDSTPQPKIEVPSETPPHVEPGIHEEKTQNPEPTGEVIKEKVPFPTSAAIPQAQSTGPNPLFIIIPGIFLLGALLGGIVYYQRNISLNSGSKPTEMPVSVATSSPSPAPTATVDLEKYGIKVLNGSGTSGEAGKVQDILEGAGFKVSSTGNASTYDYTKTVIQVKSGIESEFITSLTEALAKSYTVDPKTQSLPASSKDEVVVIVGSSKK